MITDWDDAYNNSAHIEAAETYPPRWAQLAEDFRVQKMSEERALLDLSYGNSPREKLDLFLPKGDPIGLMVFVHGGYWLKLDKSSWSHLAQGGLDRGWAVGLPSYTLCPEIRISGITAQIAAAIDYAATKVAGPLRLTGHSAGGHLVSRMCCDPSPLSEPSRTRLDRVVSISGLHDLRPLLKTKMNEGLKLDHEEAERESAALLQPLSNVAVHCWVGSQERPELCRQNDLLANIWTGFGIETTSFHEPGKHHFDVIDGLTEANSALTERLLG